MSSDLPLLSHLDESGQLRMVDVGAKMPTERLAIATGWVHMNAHAYGLLSQPGRGKGEVLNTARVAGILAAKRTAEVIPLCHTLPLSFVGIEFALHDTQCAVEIRVTCRTDAKTGVEMEAMMGVSVAALTIYDMCKAADKGILIDGVKLQYKSGGKSGEWKND
jgi:cyclic pyranopterin phosphate synthase